MIGHTIAQQIRLHQIKIARHNRKINRINKFGQGRRAIIKFMIAHSHGIKTDGLHKFCLGRATIGGIHERPLELIPRIQNDH